MIEHEFTNSHEFIFVLIRGICVYFLGYKSLNALNNAGCDDVA